MSTATVIDEVREYLDAVAACLEDVDPSERDDLLDDLEAHLREVAAEGEGTLADRLGPPEVYADELRASAGLPAMVPAPTGFAARAARSWPARGFRAIASRPTVVAVRRFLPELRPGWWVLRGYAAVVFLSILYSPDFQYFGRMRGFVAPNIIGRPAAGVAAVVAAIWASISFGRNRSVFARRFSVAVNVALIVLGVVAFQRVSLWTSAAYADVQEKEFPAYLHHADATPIENICPYKADGTPLDGVLLFDGYGRPIDNIARPEVYAMTPPSNEPVPLFRNSYPQPQRIVDPANQPELTSFKCPALGVPSATK